MAERFLAEGTGVGPKEYKIPTLAAFDRLVLIFFRDQTSAWEVDVVSGGEVVDHTWGLSSGPGFVFAYTTASINADRSTRTLAVTVDPDVSYHLSAFEGNDPPE